jgi:hypothetical protein
MAKHKFLIGVSENGTLVGAQCSRCSQIALHVNGKVPDDIREQECPAAKREDFSQAAARIVREVTEKS